MSSIREYDAHGIYFASPENWLLEESDMEKADGSLQVANGDGAFWLLKKYPFGTNPDEIIREALEAMQAEYADLEYDRFDRIQFEKAVTGYEITFFCLDLMNVAQVLSFEQDGITYAVFWQTGNQLIIHDDEEIPTERVLDAMTYSLLRGRV